MNPDLKIIAICAGLFAFFCAVVALVESRRARIRRRARRIYGKIKCREEAVAADDTKRYNFRNTRWGMDEQAVKQAEELEDLEFEGNAAESPVSEERFGEEQPAERALVFYTQAFKFPCHLAYFFSQGMLISAICRFDERYENRTTYLDMFNKLVKRVMRVHGLPANRDIFWTEEASRLNLPFSMQSVAAGQAVYITHWKTGKSVLVAKLAKGHEDVEMTLKSRVAPPFKNW